MGLLHCLVCLARLFPTSPHPGGMEGARNPLKFRIQACPCYPLPYVELILKQTPLLGHIFYSIVREWEEEGWENLDSLNSVFVVVVVFSTFLFPRAQSRSLQSSTLLLSLKYPMLYFAFLWKPLSNSSSVIFRSIKSKNICQGLPLIKLTVIMGENDWFSQTASNTSK